MKYSVFAKPLLFGLLSFAGLSVFSNPILAEAGQLLTEHNSLVQNKLPLFFTYKVKKGETLHFIAKRYGITVEDIIAYNPEARDGIEKGDKLQIPDKEDLRRIREENVTGETTKQQVEPQAIEHLVTPGQTLYAISKKYNCTVSDIVKLNPGVAKRITVGMKLKIPVSAEDAGATTEVSAVSPDSFFVHLVQSGETFWSLERKYKASRAELEAHNPVLQEGLKAGLRIRIPFKNVPGFEIVPENESEFKEHEVQKGETVFGLAKQYGLTVTELKQVNPVLDYRGLVEGEIILVPIGTNASVSTENGVENGNSEVKAYNYSIAYRPENMPAMCLPNKAARLQQYNVALLLPLYLSANDTINRVKVRPDAKSPTSEEDLELLADSFAVRRDRSIYPKSESFIEFYEGVLLAVDSLTRVGMKIKLHVFDTNQSSTRIQTILHDPNFRMANLIIGPVFPELQGPIADYAKARGIPIVSPLSSTGNIEETNPLYFKINPTKEYLIKKTADYIADEYFDKNLVVLQVGNYQNLPEAQLVNLTKEKFFSSPYRAKNANVMFNEYNLKREGSLGLSRILNKEQDNIIIIPSATEAEVSVGITSLNAKSENYPVKLIGLSNFQRFKSIQTEYFHQLRMDLLSPYFVDYQSMCVNNFISKYRKYYRGEPSQFSYQGYDVAFYFLSALYNYGSDFIGCLPYHQVDLTQGDFQFGKVNKTGGYMNEGLFILNYEPDFSIRMKGVTTKRMSAR